MEVHTHTHTARKKWTHYFWEFLMLFLAVFCGFLAENQREHYVESHRAKDYAKALLEDLAKDTVEIKDVIRENKIVLSFFDSIGAIIKNGIKNNFVPGNFYYYCTVATTSPTVVWNDVTFTQITQSGNLRYFKNRELIKRMSTYFSQSNYVTALNNNDKRYREKSMELRSRVLDYSFFSRFSAYGISNLLEVPDSLMNVLIPIKNNDKELLNEFANSFENRRGFMLFTINKVYADALKQANELMLLLKKEYNLK